MDASINLNFSKSYTDDISKVNYSNSSFNIELEEEVKISFNPNQFENLILNMIEIYADIYGEKDTRKLIQSIEEKAVV